MYNTQEIEASRHLLQTQVLSATDGKRSIDKIGKLITKKYGFPLCDAINAVRRILVEFYEDHTS